MRIPIIAQSVVVVTQLAAGTTLTALGSISGFVYFPLALLFALGLGLYLRMYRVHAAMRGLQLVLAPAGVTYVSEAGTFTAPWAAVKRVRLRRGRWISVRVPHWGGPISSFGLAGELIMPLQDTGLSWHDIHGAVTYISNGTVTPSPH
ncbi:PH domain-containing protein [Saccharopolyspora dendranthemae]|uniref:PH (Pleckstrin Homology) domain-containing protein n=1 Tax=Saccharopolyspora dendranthemae TaxID=1181886 RepID=A0A561V7R5_9PSEU|nr:PH domain-containing protein [Saccharopolyspora dendranthemae]TWG07666.1 PH (Pleckstrin Homology) domain-containing protein [Saccharopolyspora dendranthemae]